MDDFGVLVKNYGIKPQGKSAPMAASKGGSTTRTPHNYNGSTNHLDPSKPFSNSSAHIGSVLDHQNDPFEFSFTHHKPQNNGSGTGLDFEFNSALNLNSKYADVNDDIIWGFSGKSGSGNGNGNGNGNDLLSSDPVDDFLGSLGNLGLNKGKKLEENKGFSFDNDELLPGFGRSNGANDRAQASSTEKSAGLSSLEELEDFATSKVKKSTNVRSYPPKVVKNEMKKTNQHKQQEANFFDMEGSSNGHSVNETKVEKDDFSSLDELEDFATFKTKKNANVNLDASKFKNEKKKTFEHKPQETNFFDLGGSVDGVDVNQMKVESDSEDVFQAQAPDLDSFFSVHTRKSVPVSENTSMSGKTEEEPDLFFGATFSKKKSIPSASFADDLFGGPLMSGQFEEIEGESEDRRRARLERYRRTETRIGQVLANMKENEFKAQQEQEERQRIAESLDAEIKRWAAGKEGNLRALISSLQQVLGPEFNWRPVTLTDLITSSQVKVAYKKAALCVHPDKVQQRGANLQQKFVAEKVFDLLKEACNKFNSEELQ